MAIVLRFVDKDGVITEMFLDLVQVSDTAPLTLKTNLWNQLSKYDFDTSKIRGRGYDGASNMRGEWNGLQALVLQDCPYAYYVHCFTHGLQLTLVATTREVIHVFILPLIKEIMERTDMLSKALQKKSQYILNDIELFSATNESLDDFRNNKWLCLLEEVKMLCKKHEIDMSDMQAPYGRYRVRRQDNHVPFDHYYRADVFLCILDKQLQELNNRFSEHAMELLTLASNLVPNKILRRLIFMGFVFLWKNIILKILPNNRGFI